MRYLNMFLWELEVKNKNCWWLPLNPFVTFQSYFLTSLFFGYFKLLLKNEKISYDMSFKRLLSIWEIFFAEWLAYVVNFFARTRHVKQIILRTLGMRSHIF